VTHVELFRRIESLVPSLPGWCDVAKASQLASVALALRPNVVVEIGVFGGRSLFPMALACEFMQHGKVYAIDPWSKTASAEGYDGPNKEYWASLDHDGIHAHFVGTMNVLELSRRVSVVRFKSDDVHPPETIDLLHIDGQHTDQAVRDAERFGSKVTRGGFCFTDDDEWDGGGPAAACKRLMEMGFVPRYKCGTGTAFQRVT
jgi:predicted O-methyltransferase YrrM